jgi:hypothetical protein
MEVVRRAEKKGEAVVQGENRGGWVAVANLIALNLVDDRNCRTARNGCRARGNFSVDVSHAMRWQSMI